MNKYTIRVTEYRKAEILVEAENQQEALDKFEENYFKEAVAYDAILEPYDTSFEIIEENPA